MELTQQQLVALAAEDARSLGIESPQLPAQWCQNGMIYVTYLDVDDAFEYPREIMFGVLPGCLPIATGARTSRRMRS